jgi:hypothetical protein
MRRSQSQQQVGAYWHFVCLCNRELEYSHRLCVIAATAQRPCPPRHRIERGTRHLLGTKGAFHATITADGFLEALHAQRPIGAISTPIGQKYRRELACRARLGNRATKRRINCLDVAAFTKNLRERLGMFLRDVPIRRSRRCTRRRDGGEPRFR